MSTLGDQATVDYVTAFEAFKGDDNCLDSGEFVRLLASLGVEGGMETAKKILLNINTDQNATVTKVEFLEAMKHPGVNNVRIQQLRAVFEIFDHDKSGWASHADVTRVLPQLGLTEAEIKTTLVKLDDDKDGKIDFEDFLRVQLKI